MKQIIVIIFILAVGFIWYLTTPVQKESELVDFIVETGDNYHKISSRLKEADLIRSEFIFKTHLRFSPPKTLQACTYQLDKSWTISEILDEFDKGCRNNDGVVFVTIPEGRTLERTANRVAAATNNSSEELMMVWTSEEFVDEVIEKYEFATAEIKNEKIIYALEGYFFPATYELLNENVDPKYVAFRFLDHTATIYQKYQVEINESNFTFHEILTLASIVEHEAILDEDRPTVASVFYNRLEINWRLQSCATLGYALGEWKKRYSTADTEVDHIYNTYVYFGLPPGPGNMPGEASIEAVLNPAQTDYRFFVGHTCDPTDNKTYFSKTYDQHRAKVAKYVCN